MADHGTNHDAPAPDEPVTPLWVTLLGATLLIVGSIYFLIPSSEPEAAPAAAPEAPAAKPAAE